MTLVKPSRGGHPVEILLVEDSPTDRLLTIAALEESLIANNLHTVEDGEDAIRYLSRKAPHTDALPPDLVLLDLNLPKMNGLEVLAKIKNDPNLRHIPVIVLTTSEATGDIARAYTEHANSYIAKPFELEKFAQALRTVGDYWFEVVTLPPRVVDQSEATKEADEKPAKSASGLRLLLVEDNDTDALLLEHALRELDGEIAPEVYRADRLKNALSALNEQVFDAIISDLGLPDSQGLATLRSLRQAAPETPVLVLTGRSDHALGRASLQAGAQDYFVKGENEGIILSRAIRYAIDRQSLQSQLMHAQRLQAVGQLSSGLAHDFNNLLTVIRGNASLLGEGPRADSADLLEEITMAVDHGKMLTRQLLGFSKQRSFQPGEVALNPLLQTTAKLLNRLLGEVRLDLQTAADVPLIRGDASMIEQVVMNLALNARDAMPNGGVVTISTSLMTISDAEIGNKAHSGAEYPGTFVCLTVSDQGAGMEPAVLDRMWDPFFSTKSVDRGTGLGLSNVRAIALQHGGIVNVTSSPGSGSTFRVCFPVNKGASDERNSLLAQANLELPRKLRILAVDDEAPLQKVVNRILTGEGHEVLLAGSAERALRLWLADRDSIDLVLTDLLMPGGMNGMELARAIRAQGSMVPIIVASGRSVDAGLDLAGVSFLEKPFGPMELRRAVAIPFVL